MRLAFFLCLACTSVVAWAQTIEYEIYELTKLAGPRLIAKGSRTYSPSDVKVYPYTAQGRQIAEKFVELEQGYKIGARIFADKELKGFGLLAQKSDDDFSWNWYSRDFGNRFRKLRGGTLVEVKVTGQPVFEELTEVSFVEDTRLGFTVGRAEDHTHTILVRAGSVLRFK